MTEAIADPENINSSYVSRVSRMTLLAPVILEAILAAKQPEGLTMARPMLAVSGGVKRTVDVSHVKRPSTDCS